MFVKETSNHNRHNINLDFIFPTKVRKDIVKKLNMLRENNPSRLLQLLWSKRIRRLGFTNDESIRIRLAHRRYKYLRMKQVRRVDENRWVENVKNTSKYQYKSAGKIRHIIERKFLEIKRNG